MHLVKRKERQKMGWQCHKNCTKAVPLRRKTFFEGKLVGLKILTKVHPPTPLPFTQPPAELPPPLLDTVLPPTVRHKQQQQVNSIKNLYTYHFY